MFILRFLRASFAVFVIAICASAVPAWDDVGHKISSYIAWQQMSPTARERVHKILMAAPEDSDIAAFYMAGSRAEALRKMDHFVLMAYWSDIVRDRNFPVRNRNYHRSNWHYYDKFWKRVNGNIEYIPDPEDGGQALNKLNEFDAVIRGTAPDAEKAVAIAWLMHLIGDIHQPLHTSAHVTELEPKGDQGGNLFLLTPQGTPREQQENLHWLWDSIVVRNIPNKDNECDAAFIAERAGDLMKKFPAAKVAPRLAPGKYADWASESLAIAQKDVFSPDLKRFEKPSPAYMKKALKVAEERLALAGYRMGSLFERVFGQSTPATNAPN